MLTLIETTALVTSLIGGLAWLLAAALEARGNRLNWQSGLNIAAAFLCTLGAALASIAVSDVIERSPKLVAETISDVNFTPIWFLIALVLFWSRGYLPRCYGLTEAFIGMTAVFYAIKSDPTDLPPKLLALASGIYIIVRGLDNFEKGLPAEAKARWRRIFWKVQGTA